jgi:isopenicillin N synthase-like dioxygenase
MAATSSLPIVDFSVWTSEGTPLERLTIAKELVTACHETGFVHIRNHGVSQRTLDSAFAWTKKFFDKSHEKKMEAEKPSESIAFRGYIRQGVQKAVQVLDGDKEAVQNLRTVPDFNVR